MRVIRPTLGFLVLLTLLFGAVYPAVCTAVLQALFPTRAEGSMMMGKNGKVLGSSGRGKLLRRKKFSVL